MYSNSRNDVPRVAQRYGTMAVHTRHRAAVLVDIDMMIKNPNLVFSFWGRGREDGGKAGIQSKDSDGRGVRAVPQCIILVHIAIYFDLDIL